MINVIIFSFLIQKCFLCWELIQIDLSFINTKCLLTYASISLSIKKMASPAPPPIHAHEFYTLLPLCAARRSANLAPYSEAILLGLMDMASDFDSEDCEPESHRRCFAMIRAVCFSGGRTSFREHFCFVARGMLQSLRGLIYAASSPSNPSRSSSLNLPQPHTVSPARTSAWPA